VGADFRLPEEEMGEGGHLLAEINVTPLIDIFLVLLIIFMVTSSILSEQGHGTGLNVNLPSGQSRLDAKGTQLVVGISATGDVMIEGKKIAPDLLAEAFKRVLAQDPNVVVVLYADQSSYTGKAVEVNGAGQAGRGEVPGDCHPRPALSGDRFVPDRLLPSAHGSDDPILLSSRILSRIRDSRDSPLPPTVGCHDTPDHGGGPSRAPAGLAWSLLRPHGISLHVLRPSKLGEEREP